MDLPGCGLVFDGCGILCRTSPLLLPATSITVNITNIVRRESHRVARSPMARGYGVKAWTVEYCTNPVHREKLHLIPTKCWDVALL